MEDAVSTRLAMIFTEWERRSDSGVDVVPKLPDIGSVLVSEYGALCAEVFVKIAVEMDAAGLLPRLGKL